MIDTELEEELANVQIDPEEEERLRRELEEL